MRSPIGIYHVKHSECHAPPLLVNLSVCSLYLCYRSVYLPSSLHIDGHESKPANSNFSIFLVDKFEGITFYMMC